MKLLLLFTLVAVALSQPKEESEQDIAKWEKFKIAYERDYSTKEEEVKRKTIFMKNLKFIREHNEKFEKGEVTFDVGVNRFADLTTEEFATKMNGYNQSLKPSGKGEEFNEPEDVELPATVDWRKEGAVTEVMDQGDCRSCWAFSATGSIEGQHFIKTKKLVSLSKQNLVDCSTKEGNHGCNGGLMELAYVYVIKNNGIDTEKSYPYEAKDGQCRYNVANRGATVDSYVNIPSGSEEKLQIAVAKKGPISVAIDSRHISFQFYKSGLYFEPDCKSGPKDIDHGVLAVGYGTVMVGGDYWLVKNSFGTGWGMNGYIMMARNYNNQCGIATDASCPNV